MYYVNKCVCAFPITTVLDRHVCVCYVGQNPCTPLGSRDASPTRQNIINEKDRANHTTISHHQLEGTHRSRQQANKNILNLRRREAKALSLPSILSELHHFLSTWPANIHDDGTYFADASRRTA